MSRKVSRMLVFKKNRTANGDECIVYPREDGEVDIDIMGGLLSGSVSNFDKHSFYLVENNDESGSQQCAREINRNSYLLTRKSQISWPVSYYYRKHPAEKD